MQGNLNPNLTENSLTPEHLTPFKPNSVRAKIFFSKKNYGSTTNYFARKIEPQLKTESEFKKKKRNPKVEQ